MESLPPGERPTLTGQQSGPEDSLNNDIEMISEECCPSPDKLSELSLTKKDIYGWTKKDAFRRFYMNWRCGMREASNLDTRPSVDYVETVESIILRASRSVHDSRPCGFIQLDKEKGTLVFDIVNGQVLHGYHGNVEQPARPWSNLLKAAMVMVDAGFQVCFESRSDRWVFAFNSDHFYFCRAPSTEQTFMFSLNENWNSSTASDGVTANDLLITIGPGGSFTRKVGREKFLAWLTITVDVVDVAHPVIPVSTPYGDLLLDSDSANKVYVNGILLSTRQTGPFHFGYHFHDEDLAAEEMELACSRKETRFRCMIWLTAIETEYDVLVMFKGLLRFSQKSMDIAHVEEYLQPSTAVRLWQSYLPELGPEKLFCQETDDISSVKYHTDREIVIINSLLWSIFRRHSLIRTWEEELLFKADIASKPKSSFSSAVQHMFRALLQLDPYTAKTHVACVDQPLLSTSVHYDSYRRQFRASRDWLDFHAVHRVHWCRVIEMRGVDVILTNFPCDHVVISFYEAAIEAAAKTLPPDRAASWVHGKRQMAVEKIEEMPRQVTIRTTPRVGTVCVLWQHGFSPGAYGMMNPKYHVELHEENCHGRTAAIHVHSSPTSPTAPCGCPQKFPPPKKMVAQFDNLNVDKKYVAIVALDIQYSIYSLRSAPTEPRPDPQARVSVSAMVNPDGVDREMLGDFWDSWQKTNFPSIFSLFTPKYRPAFLQGIPSCVAVYQNARLRHRFEREQHIIVMMKTAGNSGMHEMRSYLLYIHGIVVPTPNNAGDEGSLVVTMFSFVRTTSLCMFGVGLGDMGVESVGLRELLLHYWRPDAMGQCNDSMLFPINEIAVAYPVDSAMLGPPQAVQYCFGPPPDVCRTGYYCRYAVQGTIQPSDSGCIMPVASHLLGPAYRWVLPQYAQGSRPSVVDLSPGTLGLTEGFAPYCNIVAGFGFDPAAHYTWKARYPSARIYDGTLHDILSDLYDRKLSQPTSGPPGTPRIVLMAIPDRGHDRTWETVVEDFKALQHIAQILTSFPNRPDFFVFTFPSYILLQRASIELFRTMYALLNSRYAIHIKHVHLPRHGIAIDNSLIMMVASCVPTPFPWAMFDKSLFEPATVSIGRHIEDLAFSNERVVHIPFEGEICAMTCMHPRTGEMVYNHTTGVDSECAVSVDVGRGVCLGLDVLRVGIKHPQRSDLLTPRELARLQAFPDNFIFLGPREQICADILNAVSPLIGRKVAACVYAVIGRHGGGFRQLPADGFLGGSGGANGTMDNSVVSGNETANVNANGNGVVVDVHGHANGNGNTMNGSAHSHPRMNGRASTVISAANANGNQGVNEFTMGANGRHAHVPAHRHLHGNVPLGAGGNATANANGRTIMNGNTHPQPRSLPHYRPHYHHQDHTNGNTPSSAVSSVPHPQSIIAHLEQILPDPTFGSESEQEGGRPPGTYRQAIRQYLQTYYHWRQRSQQEAQQQARGLQMLHQSQGPWSVPEPSMPMPIVPAVPLPASTYIGGQNTALAYPPLPNFGAKAGPQPAHEPAPEQDTDDDATEPDPELEREAETEAESAREYQQPPASIPAPTTPEHQQCHGYERGREQGQNANDDNDNEEEYESDSEFDWMHWTMSSDVEEEGESERLEEEGGGEG